MTHSPLVPPGPLWPILATGLGPDEIAAAQQYLAVASTRFVALEHLPKRYAQLFPRLYIPMAAWLLSSLANTSQSYLVGVAGAQGTGKTTAAKALQLTLQYAYGKRCCLLSLDDFYLPHAQRQALGQDVHPLLAVRGVPGTHDIALLNETLRLLCHADDDAEIPLPSFDKATDDRRPQEHWSHFRGRPDIILFEGWCVGARPAPADEKLSHPLNRVESESDSQSVWRRYVDQQLTGAYGELFAQLDRLVFLAAPDWERILEWRHLQECKLYKVTGKPSPLLDEKNLRHFIATYERVSRRMLREAPHYADAILKLSEDHQFTAVDVRSP